MLLMLKVPVDFMQGVDSTGNSGIMLSAVAMTASEKNGGLAEWLNAAVLKTAEG